MTGSEAHRRDSARDADVIVVGAGPAGSATAYHLARTGLDVLLLEKTAFPREKVCGDGLTPRAVQVAGRHGHRHLAGGRLAPQPGPADHRRRPPARDRRGRTWPTTRRTGWSGAAPTSTRLLARTAQKAGARLHERTVGHRPGAGRADRPRAGRDRARDRGGRQQGARGHLPRAAGGRRRRQLLPALARGRARPRDGPADGRRGAHLLHEPAARGRLAGVLAGAVGLLRRRRRGCCPGTAGSSASATARRTSASGSSTPARRSRTSTTRPC